MAIYLFRKMVADLKQDGLDFSECLVVPEVDATTGENLHQREEQQPYPKENCWLFKGRQDPRL